MLSVIAKLLKVLNSDDNPAQLALAVVFALIMGLTPLMSPHNILILLLVLFVRVNLGFFIVSFGLFSGLAYLLDPLSNQLGATVLHSEGLQTLWTGLYQASFWRFIGYNNTLIMGSVCLSLIMAIPLYLAVIWALTRYRDKVRAKIAQSRLALLVKGTSLFKLYAALN
ncbi:MAG: hypothetical protein ACI89D_000483 [Bermanella sp.]